MIQFSLVCVIVVIDVTDCDLQTLLTIIISQEHESSRKYLEQLFASDPVKIKEAVEFLKNVAIGSNKQKEAIIQLGLVPRFLQIIDAFSENHDQEELLVETTAVINSLAKGSEDHSRCLIEAGTIPTLFGVGEQSQKWRHVH